MKRLILVLSLFSVGYVQQASGTEWLRNLADAGEDFAEGLEARRQAGAEFLDDVTQVNEGNEKAFGQNIIQLHAMMRDMTPEQRHAFKLSLLKKNTKIQVADRNAAGLVEAADKNAAGLIEAEKIKQEIANKGSKENLELILNFFSQPKNIALTAGGIIAIVAISYAAKKLADEGIPLLFKTRPHLVIETSLPETMMENLGLVTKERPRSRRADLVYPAALHKKLADLIEIAKLAVKNKKLLKNMFFFGEPGTGKSLVARELAILSGADYVIVNCASFAQLPVAEALKEFSHVMAFTKLRSKPVFIVLEEVDALFPKRETASDLNRKLTDAFIAEINKPSDAKRAYILTSNSRQIDSAVLSRISKSAMLKFDTPDEAARVELLKVYGEKILGRSSIGVDPRVFRSFKSLAADMQGWVGRDIEQFMIDVLDKAGLKSERAIVPTDLKMMINEYNKNREDFGIAPATVPAPAA